VTAWSRAKGCNDSYASCEGSRSAPNTVISGGNLTAKAARRRHGKPRLQISERCPDRGIQRMHVQQCKTGNNTIA
jgi:hypothetical protein